LDATAERFEELRERYTKEAREEFDAVPVDELDNDDNNNSNDKLGEQQAGTSAPTVPVAAATDQLSRQV
jgi:hypothetical protein